MSAGVPYARLQGCRRGTGGALTRNHLAGLGQDLQQNGMG